MKEYNFGTKYLVEALNRCSEETQEEVSSKLEKIAEEIEDNH